MKLIERALIPLLHMAPDECLDISQRLKLHALHRLAKVLGCPCISSIERSRLLLFQTALLEFLAAAAWAGVVGADSRDFHAIFMRLLTNVVG